MLSNAMIHSSFERERERERERNNGEIWTYRKCERMTSYSAYATSSKMTSFFTVIGEDCWDIYLFY
jgi:hypothetical protein